MITDYILLILAAFLLAMNFALNKIYQNKAGTGLRAGFLFNALSGIFTAVIFWPVTGFSMEFPPFSLIMATALSALIIVYTLLGFRIMKSGSMALYTLFLMVGGMSVPYVYGLLFLNEEFSLLRLIGLFVLVLAVVFSSITTKAGKTSAAMLALCIAVFVLNGFVSVISKVHQVETVYRTVDTIQFVVISGITKFILAGAVYIIILIKDKKQAPSVPSEKPKPSVLLTLIIISSAVCGISTVLQLFGAKNLPATVLYPFITGGSMIFSAALGMIAFREKPSKAVIASVALSFVGTLMFL